MTCSAPYDELMSLKLDGLLDPGRERLLHEHIETCADCATLWAAMQQADTLLCASVVAPVAMPADFQARVMLKIAAIPVYLPEYEVAVAAAPAPNWGYGLSTLAAAGHTLPDSDMLQEWQKRIGQYARIVMGAGLSVAGTAGLVIGLVMTGVVQVSGPVADWVAMVRTFFSALSTWVMSVVDGIGGGTVAGVALVMGIMALAGWQLVSAYHRTLAVEGTAGATTPLVEALS
jgi:anti-sigma factor RsiW